MKLSTKIILPIILISALLILLAGCFGVPADESPETTTTGGGTITGIIAAPCCYTLGEPLSGNSGSPEYWCYWCEKDWYIQGSVEGVEVILTSGQVKIDTTTTDEFGVYTFTDVPPGENYVITAYCPDKEMPLVMDVVPELTKGGSFDAGTTDLVSTSLGLVVDYVTYFAAWDPEDISLDKVIAAKPNFDGFPKFKKLIREVRRVLENCEDVDEDDKLLDVLCKAAEEVGKSDFDCAPGFTPVLEAEEDSDPGPGPGPGPTPPVTYVLTAVANPTEGGTVTGGGTYDAGTTATVKATATPNTGWYFVEWSGDLTGDTNPASITMNSNKSVTAHFFVEGEPDTYTLAVTINGNGSVTKNPDQATYIYGTDVTLTPTPDPGWAFSGWSDADDSSEVTGSGTVQDPYTIVMNGNKTVTANFTELMGTVSGKICQHNGNGYGKATVYFRNTSTDFIHSAVGESGSGSGSGDYSINLPAGSYVLWADKQSGEGNCSSSVGYNTGGNNPSQDPNGYICLTISAGSTDFYDINIWVDNIGSGGTCEPPLFNACL